MSKKVDFKKRRAFSFGQHGMQESGGVEISDIVEDNMIQIQTLSKDSTYLQPCLIRVPRNQEILEELSQAFADLADSI